MDDNNYEQVNRFWNYLSESQLSSVEFVQDYLQLRFDGPCINIYNPLTIKTKDKKITSWNPGFRDLLCEQITKVVDRVEFESGLHLNIIFRDSSEIILSLKPGDYRFDEAYFAHGFENDGWSAE